MEFSTEDWTGNLLRGFGFGRPTTVVTADPTLIRPYLHFHSTSIMISIRLENLTLEALNARNTERHVSDLSANTVEWRANRVLPGCEALGISRRYETFKERQ